MTDDAWEQIRHMTLDQIVTRVKLYGSGGQLHGFTTPEGWPFRLVVAVGGPGNERAIELCDELKEKMLSIASASVVVERKDGEG